MVSKYIKIYHKRNILVAFGCATIVSIPLFVVSLFYDVLQKDTLISFIPYVIAVVCVYVASLYTVRFKKMIETQELLYKVKFSDTDAEHLETTLYLSEEWLIWAGSCAIYKEHIKSVKSALRHGRVGASYEITIKTVDDKQYKIWCRSASNVKKIAEWKDSEIYS